MNILNKRTVSITPNMKVFAIISLFLISRSASANDGVLELLQCDTIDLECLNRSTAKFLQGTHKGMPERDIKTIDPLIIPSLSSSIIDYEYRNLTITGLKAQNISDFKLDLEKKIATLVTKAKINITGDFSAIIPKSKTFARSFAFRGIPLTTASYSTELKRDKKGVLHFELGPETITCKLEQPVEIQCSPNLVENISTDKGVKKICNEKTDAVRASAFCSILAEAYKTVIHNIRVAARLLPASAFFKNIDQ